MGNLAPSACAGQRNGAGPAPLKCAGGHRRQSSSDSTVYGGTYGNEKKKRHSTGSMGLSHYEAGKLRQASAGGGGGCAGLRGDSADDSTIGLACGASDRERNPYAASVRDAENRVHRDGKTEWDGRDVSAQSRRRGAGSRPGVGLEELLCRLARYGWPTSLCCCFKTVPLACWRSCCLGLCIALLAVPSSLEIATKSCRRCSLVGAHMSTARACKSSTPPRTRLRARPSREKRRSDLGRRTTSRRRASRLWRGLVDFFL